LGSPGRRVLIIVQNLPVPFDRRVWLEATTLQTHGYDVTVICPKLKGFNASRETIEDVEVFRYPMPFDPRSKLGFLAEFAWAWVATLLLSIRVAIAGRGFDVIHACNPPETYWALALLWKVTGKKFIFDHHDLSPEMYEAKFGGSGSLMHRLLLFMERRTFRTADVVLATNESHRTTAIDRGRVDRDRIFIVRSGPDLKRLNRYPPDSAWARSKKHVITYLGDISAQDGVDGLIRVVVALTEMRDDFHTVVIGGGSAWEDVRRYAEEKGVADLFTFTGVVSDVVLCRALSSATVAVDTVPRNSWSDRSTMNKIMEYMYFGLPIVAYDLTETKRSAADAALTAAPGDEAGFAVILDRLLDDPEQRERMSSAGRARLESLLSWEHSVPHLLEAYECALSGKARVSRDSPDPTLKAGPQGA
jgi:glycosyltransferase involved in cell wall biosynthesis